MVDKIFNYSWIKSHFNAIVVKIVIKKRCNVVQSDGSCLIIFINMRFVQKQHDGDSVLYRFYVNTISNNWERLAREDRTPIDTDI